MDKKESKKDANGEEEKEKDLKNVGRIGQRYGDVRVRLSSGSRD